MIISRQLKLRSPQYLPDSFKTVVWQFENPLFNGPPTRPCPQRKAALSRLLGGFGIDVTWSTPKVYSQRETPLSVRQILSKPVSLRGLFIQPTFQI